MGGQLNPLNSTFSLLSPLPSPSPRDPPTQQNPKPRPDCTTHLRPRRQSMKPEPRPPTLGKFEKHDTIEPYGGVEWVWIWLGFGYVRGERATEETEHTFRLTGGRRCRPWPLRPPPRRAVASLAGSGCAGGWVGAGRWEGKIKRG